MSINACTATCLIQLCHRFSIYCFEVVSRDHNRNKLITAGFVETALYLQFPALLHGKYVNETMKETLYEIYHTHTIADARRLAALYYQRHQVNEDTDGYDTVDEDGEDYEHEQLCGCQCLKRLLL